MQPLYHEYMDVQGDFISYEDFNKNFRLKRPASFNFAYDVVDRLGREDPERPALLWTDPEGDVVRYDFRRMMLDSNRAANYFKSIGVKKGDAVMLILKRHHEFWPIIIALHKIGAITIPATHLLTAKDIRYRVQAADVTTIVCTEHTTCVADAVEEAAPDCPTLKNRVLVRTKRPGWLSYDEGFAAASDVWEKPTGDAYAQNEDIMLLYFTSGTTGMPKMAVHTYTYPLAQIATAAYWHNLDDTSLHIAVADTGWAKAGWGKIYGQWICGACLFVYDFDRFVATDMLRMLEKYQVTSFCAPPTVYRFMIKEDMSRYDLSHLKWANTAGEPLNPEVFNQFKRFTGVELHEAFGQSETTPLLMTSKWMTPRMGSTGRPSPHYHIDLVDQEGRSVEDGVEGEIVVRLDQGHPAGLLREYYRDPVKTAEVFRGGMYHTGDMAWRDVDGYYYFIGRSDDVIKSSGYRIGPFEVESALMEHPAVLECAITAVPHPERGQVVKATIVLTKGYTPSDALVKELQNHVKHATAPYKYPRIVEFVDELPKTVSGKIQRVKIRNGDLQAHS